MSHTQPFLVATYKSGYEKSDQIYVLDVSEMMKYIWYIDPGNNKMYINDTQFFDNPNHRIYIVPFILSVLSCFTVMSALSLGLQLIQ